MPNQMPSVVFLMYHGMGHFNACFRMAKLLKKDHDVIFAGVEFYKKYIESQGFMYYALKTVPFGMGFETWVNGQEKKKNIYWNSLKDRWTNRLFNLRQTELDKLMHDLEPDYLLIDSLQATDFIVLYPWLKNNPVKFGFIQTMLPTVLDENIPPINSTVLPGDAEGIRKAINAFHKNKRNQTLRQKFMWLGVSDSMLIKRGLRKNDIPKKFYPSENVLRGIAFETVHEFILAPKEFDFNSTENPFRHYIGFMPDEKRMEIADTTYFKVDAEIRKKLKDSNGTLLYCSFGSVRSEDTRAVNTFLQKLVRVVDGANCVLIISATSIHHDSDLKEIPDNVYVLKAAPQLEILERTDVFITHGGLNSIKESIYAGVPMLIYPPHSVYDTMGNSTRVVHYKLGLRGDIRLDTEEEISDKIEELINNDAFKENIYALREIDNQYTSRFIDVLKSLQPL